MGVSLLIGTCDSYSWVWPLFLTQYKKYWRVDCPVVVAGETLPFNEPEFHNVLLGIAPWSTRMKAAVETIDTEFTMVFLEDYLIQTDITEELIAKHIDFLRIHKADKIMLDQVYEDPHTYYLDRIQDELYMFRPDSNYKNSVQPSVWDTKYLKSVLLEGKSPWEFEVECNAYTTSLNPRILLSNIGRLYFGLCRRGGHLELGWEEFFKKENLCL